MKSLFLLAIWVRLIFLASPVIGQEKTFEDRDLSLAVRVSSGVRKVTDITYASHESFEAKLDVYYWPLAKSSLPTVIYFHGGGWGEGSKESYEMEILPFLAMGLSLVNVEYRTSKIALAPAAVEDCRCALRWVVQNAKRYKFDPTKIVLTGRSAGGHLALITSVAEPSLFDTRCPGKEKLAVAAIINRSGITDVVDLLEGPNKRDFSVRWIGMRSDRLDVAKKVSPLTHIKSGLPPILTIHGDSDRTVPYQHAVRLHQLLSEKKVPNQLLTIKGGGHGPFSAEQNLSIYSTIAAFLERNKLLN